MKKIILFLLLSLMFSNETDRTFHLKNGDKITGEVLTETEISFPKREKVLARFLS